MTFIAFVDVSSVFRLFANPVGLLSPLAFFLAFPTGLALWYADHLLLFFKQDPTLVALARPYFHFAAMSMLPLLAGVVIAQFYAGIGKPRRRDRQNLHRFNYYGRRAILH